MPNTTNILNLSFGHVNGSERLIVAMRRHDRRHIISAHRADGRWFLGQAWDLSCPPGTGMGLVEMIRRMADVIVQFPGWENNFHVPAGERVPNREDVVRQLVDLFPVSSYRIEEFLTRCLS